MKDVDGRTCVEVKDVCRAVDGLRALEQHKREKPPCTYLLTYLLTYLPSNTRERSHCALTYLLTYLATQERGAAERHACVLISSLSGVGSTVAYQGLAQG